MGVRGLTSYIARNAEQYLKPFELHDCNLVIDGDNLACNLYKDVTGAYSAFGGDYDDFYRSVVDFFHVLAECNVKSYVLMDGGYEFKKIRTVSQRLRGKISVIKKINPCGSITVFPLHMKEVFVDALKDCNVPVMRCVFEADDELAALARKLNCPVLSYDSDFYIHNVKYIPLITLTIKAHTKEIKYKDNVEQKLRKNEAKNMEKRTKSEKIISNGIVVDNVDKTCKRSNRNTYKYIDCCIYRVENLFRKGSLSKEKLPLFAAMLGNDYIARSAFKNFFSAGMGKLGRSRKINHQQKRIRLIIRWLRTESLETALQRILSRLKKAQREILLFQVQSATCGYANLKCISYDFFIQNYANAFKDFVNYNDSSSEFGDSSEEESLFEDDLSAEEATSVKSQQNMLYAYDNVSDREYEQNEANGNSDKEPDDYDDDELENREKEDEDAISDEKHNLPEWFLKKLYPARLPRYFVDLLHLKKYINSPQIEHFPFPDCNEVALPILIYSFTLLHSVEGEEPIFGDNGEEIAVLTYLGRKPKVTDVHYQKYRIGDYPKFPYYPDQPNPLLLRGIFEQGMSKSLQVDELFEKLSLLPADLRLYFLAIVYWLQKSQHCDLLHLHALIICLVTLRTNDSNIPVVRDIKAFQKRFGKIINKEKHVRSMKALEGGRRSIREDLLYLTIPERMEYIPKSDCYLTQDNLLKHFHMQEIFKKKYDLYSSTVLHAFAEFQSVLFQLCGLNALLDFPYQNPKMGQLFCGVFLYNLYDLLKSRWDIRYYVANFLLQDSQMMFDFYCYLYDWFDEFIPSWKRMDSNDQARAMPSKKIMKKQRQSMKKQEMKSELQNRTHQMTQTERAQTNVVHHEDDNDEFYDLNNKFSAFLKFR